mmetsp:Transcript_39043/g.101159  ORF Transcript_39043/g.101159 Transcript_39043/m.101159 type:complete len:276 (+) Transcript_39043:941-1768(+)
MLAKRVRRRTQLRGQRRLLAAAPSVQPVERLAQGMPVFPESRTAQRQGPEAHQARQCPHASLLPRRGISGLQRQHGLLHHATEHRQARGNEGSPADSRGPYHDNQQQRAASPAPQRFPLRCVVRQHLQQWCEVGLAKLPGIHRPLCKRTPRDLVRGLGRRLRILLEVDANVATGKERVEVVVNVAAGGSDANSGGGAEVLTVFGLLLELVSEGLPVLRVISCTLLVAASFRTLEGPLRRLGGHGWLSTARSRSRGLFGRSAVGGGRHEVRSCAWS